MVQMVSTSARAVHSARCGLQVRRVAGPISASPLRSKHAFPAFQGSKSSRRTIPAASREDAHAPLDARLLGAAGLLMPYLLDAEPAMAGDPLLTGKTVSLIHPAMMLFLFGISGYTAYLGFQWKRTREIPLILKEMKASLPAADAEGARPSSPLDAEISALEAERKTLLKGNYREQHWNYGSLLLALGVGIAIEGPLNTWFRTGKLFPGPHLFAGAGIVALWAAAAALVPSMQKGSETARALHITFNCINLLLFAWQIPTGFEIVQKVWEFAPWP